VEKIAQIDWIQNLIQSTLLCNHQNTASIYDNDYPYLLLAPTMLTLLQQQPHGHQQRQQLAE